MIGLHSDLPIGGMEKSYHLVLLRIHGRGSRRAGINRRGGSVGGDHRLASSALDFGVVSRVRTRLIMRRMVTNRIDKNKGKRIRA
jgi:hypothetical protein